MIKVATKILESLQLLNIESKQQTELVKQFCTFLSRQVSDMRLRAERSNVLKPVIKDTSGEQLADEEKRDALYRIIFNFISAFFRWENNFQRCLKSLVTKDETKRIQEE